MLFWFVFLLLTTGVACHEHHGHEGHIRGLATNKPGEQRCHTREPDERDFFLQKRATNLRSFLQKRERTFFRESSNSTDGYVIPICFHVPQYRSNILNRLAHKRKISDAQLEGELRHLNAGFTSSSCCDSRIDRCAGSCSVDVGISFALALLDDQGNVVGTTDSFDDPNACITRPKRNRWMKISLGLPLREFNMKRKLRRGDESVLNVYYTRSVSTLARTTLLGFATFPWDYDNNPRNDGVVIEPGTIHGGASENYNEGDTLIHEVGHWLGLFHTFEGGGCLGPGDQVSDTPAQKTATRGCEWDANVDSCLLQPGKDPIFNFLDYSYDVCMFEFTNGQKERMLETLEVHRNPKARKARVATEIASDGDPNFFSLYGSETQLFSLPVPHRASVTCSVSSSEDDDIEILMNWSGDFDHFDCHVQSSQSIRSCTIGPGSGRAHIVVYAADDASDLSVSCTIEVP